MTNPKPSPARPRQPMIVHLDKRSMNKIKNGMILASFFGTTLGIITAGIILGVAAAVLGAGQVGR